jgi:predicted RNase H-like HicB family nuclease
MKMHTFTAVLRREGDGYVSLCPELDVASQGDTVEHALAMLREAVEGVLESAPREEIEQRLGGQIFVTQFEAAYA